MKKLNNLQKAALLGEAALTMSLGPVVVSSSTQDMLTSDLNLVTTIVEQPDFVPNVFGGTALERVAKEQEPNESILGQYEVLYTSETIRKNLRITYEDFSRLSSRRRELILSLADNGILGYLRDAEGGFLKSTDLEDLEMVFKADEVLPSTEGKSRILLNNGVTVSEITLENYTYTGATNVQFLQLEKHGVGYSIALDINPHVAHTPMELVRSNGTNTSIVTTESRLRHELVIHTRGDEFHFDLADPELLGREDRGDVDGYLLNHVFWNLSAEDEVVLSRFASDAFMYVDGDGVVFPADKYSLTVAYGDNQTSQFLLRGADGMSVLIDTRYLDDTDAGWYKDVSGFVLRGRDYSDSNANLAPLDMSGKIPESFGNRGYAYIDAGASARVSRQQEALETHPELKLLNFLGFNVFDVSNLDLHHDFLESFQDASFCTEYGDCVRLSNEAMVFDSEGDILTVSSGDTSLHIKLSYEINDNLDIVGLRVYRGYLTAEYKDPLSEDGVSYGVLYPVGSVMQSVNGIDFQPSPGR